MLVARKSERGVSILLKLGITGRSGPAGLFVTTMDGVYPLPHRTCGLVGENLQNRSLAVTERSQGENGALRETGTVGRCWSS